MDDDQQFCLRWNNHQSTLISVFDTLLENGTLVDCTLAAEGKFLKAHKVVLSACSPYFASLLSQQYDKHPIFILKDVKFQELRAMMDYMYRGEVNISQDQLAALLKAAESLQIKGLSDSRGGGSSATPAQAQHLKSDSVKSHVPAPKASGLTIENKRPLLRTLGNDFDVDVSASREGSVSPNTRKRKKINAARRKSNTESNSLLENDQHSNSSSHSLANNQPISNNTSATSATAPNLLSVVTKKTETQQQQHQVDKITDQQLDNEDSADDDDEDMNESNEQQVAKRTKHDDTVNKHDADHLLEPKNEYDDDNENVEDLTLDDEELLDDLDQAGPSHGGEGSSQGYHWQLDGRSQDEALMAAQEAAGQHRDAQDDSSTSFSSLPSFRVTQSSPLQQRRLKVIPESQLLSGGSNSPSSSPNDNCKRVITTEELHHNLMQRQNLVSYNKTIPAMPGSTAEFFTQYLMQQQQQSKMAAPYKSPAFSLFTKNGSGPTSQTQPSTSSNLSNLTNLPNISSHPLTHSGGGSINSNNNLNRPPNQQIAQPPAAAAQGQVPSREMIPYKCPLCNLNYRTQAFLNEHLRKEHSVLI